MVTLPRPSKLSISSIHLLQSAWASISPQTSLATPAVRVAGPLTVPQERLWMRCRTTTTRMTSVEAAGCSCGL
ncbi:hypothetical protein K438DRAFT_1855098 [Mycena galopus ATCC 62051]|nr:hypothetical protein K438DRAFT_1855098 [Mycena galopus ATCC 62051]